MSTNKAEAKMTIQNSRTMQERIKGMGNNLSLLIAIVALCIILGFTNKFFWTWDNWMTLLLSAAVLIIRASGATVAMLTGGMDISQNSVGAFSGILIATLALNNAEIFPAWLCILLSIGLGFALGSLNAFLIAHIKINPIITTLGTMMIYRGFAWLINGKTMMIADPTLIAMGRERILTIKDATGDVTFPGIPYSVIIAIAIFIFIYWLLKYTSYGRKIYMVGGNENASFLSGINASRVKFIAYLFSSVTASYAGFLLACQVGAALPQSGAGTEMLTIAAVVLGGLSLSGGKGSMTGTMLGILILTIISNGLDLNQIQSQVQLSVTGAVLILAVLLDVVRSGSLKKQ